MSIDADKRHGDGLWLFFIVVEDCQVDSVSSLSGEGSRCSVARVTLDGPECATFARHSKEIAIAVNGAGEFLAIWIIGKPAAVEDHAASDDCRKQTALALNHGSGALIGSLSKDDMIGIGNIQILSCPPSIGQRIQHVLRALVASTDMPLGITRDSARVAVSGGKERRNGKTEEHAIRGLIDDLLHSLVVCLDSGLNGGIIM